MLTQPSAPCSAPHRATLSGKEGNGRKPAGFLLFATYRFSFLRKPAGFLLFVTYGYCF